MTFVGEQAPVRTIAHWEAAHRNVLADEPQLRSIIDNELLYGLRLEEDDQILNGSGTGEDLTGILNVSGIQTYSWSSGPSTAPVADTKADAIRRAMTLAFLFTSPPASWSTPRTSRTWSLPGLQRSVDGSEYPAGTQARVWAFRSSAQLSLRVPLWLVLAWRLYDRDEASIRVAEQHSDFFVRNAVVILAEQRLALACKRPEASLRCRRRPTVA